MHLLAKGGPGPACPGSLSPGAPCHYQPGGSLTLETLSQVLVAHRYPGRSMGSQGAAHLLQALNVGLQAGRAGPQLTVLLVQLLQPGAQGLGWDLRSCPRPPHMPTQGPELLTSQDGVHTSGVGKPHIYRKAVATERVPGPRAPGSFSRRLLVLVASVTLMGDQATASTQPPPNAPSCRAPTPRHHHGSSVPSGLQHLWASPLFVTVTF